MDNDRKKFDNVIDELLESNVLIHTKEDFLQCRGG